MKKIIIILSLALGALLFMGCSPTTQTTHEGTYKLLDGEEVFVPIDCGDLYDMLYLELEEARADSVYNVIKLSDEYFSTHMDSIAFYDWWAPSVYDTAWANKRKPDGDLYHWDDIKHDGDKVYVHWKRFYDIPGDSTSPYHYESQHNPEILYAPANWCEFGTWLETYIDSIATERMNK